MRSSARTFVLALLTSLALNTETSAEPQGAWPPLAAEARLTVLYWPSFTACSGCQYPVRAALQEVARDNAGIAVVSVVPADLGLEGPVLATLALPGRLLPLEPQAYAATIAADLLPRVEAWDAKGRLLVARSVANTIREATRVREEIEVALSFTTPANEAL